jgi:hypothetical protein
VKSPGSVALTLIWFGFIVFSVTLGWRLYKLQPAPPALPHCDLAIGVRTGEQSIDYCFNRTDGRGHPVEMTEQDAKTLRENLPCPAMNNSVTPKRFDSLRFSVMTVTQGKLHTAICHTCGKYFIVEGNGFYWHLMLHGDFSYVVIEEGRND